MAAVKERKGKFVVIYDYKDENGKRRQKWETYNTKAEARRRKKQVEFKQQEGTFVVPRCKNLQELLQEYVTLYGKDKWALSTYTSNQALIRNYILPMVGNIKLEEINTLFLEKYYQTLQSTPAVVNPINGKPRSKYVSNHTIHEVHKLLRNCFEQAVKWELMDKNPATHATVPKHKKQEREIWTVDTLARAMEVCNDELLSLAINLAFAGSLRMGELLALTWDCVDISPAAIKEERAFIYVNKELQRVSKTALDTLDKKDVLLIFPEECKKCTTVRVLKLPKTDKSIRKVYLPGSVAQMLVRRKEEQEEIKSIIGDEYKDYDLVITTSFGMPYSESGMRKKFDNLIEKYNLPRVVFHSLRHSSVTYKLKLNGGDIKAVQGDSGHSQVSMVTEVYSHIIDEDRRKNAQLFEEAFYGRKNLNPQLHREEEEGKTVTVPEGMDPNLLQQVLSNPEMTALLAALAKSLGKG